MGNKTMSKHTPGPWSNMGAHVLASMVSTTLQSGRRVRFRVAALKDGDIDTVKANTALIAAAPDLLAALHAAAKMLEFHDAKCKALKLARAAIAKAEGVS
jgi:hypothetical protein